jgi:hypothetical protein
MVDEAIPVPEAKATDPAEVQGSPRQALPQPPSGEDMITLEIEIPAGAIEEVLASAGRGPVKSQPHKGPIVIRLNGWQKKTGEGGPPGEPGRPAVKVPLGAPAAVPFPRFTVGALLAITGFSLAWAKAGHPWAAGPAFLAVSLALGTFLRWAGLRSKGAGLGIWHTLERVRSYVANEPASFEYEGAEEAEASVPRP